MNLKFRLSALNFLEFGVWGAYLTSMGAYLHRVDMASNIGYFYSVQGMVSLFMPALMGIIADRWVQAQRLLSICHLLAGLFMFAACGYGEMVGTNVQFAPLFLLYTLSIAFFMPTIALSYSVAYSALEKQRLDTVKAFPPIRIWGTIGFIASMWIVDIFGWQFTPLQFGWSSILSLVMAFYSLTMPKCEIKPSSSKSLVEALGLRAFTLFKSYRMAVFFIFSFFLGVCLQITNGFANPFIQSFGKAQEYANTFGVQHANILISLSQVSETLCILLIPFCLKKFGIKYVMLIAMLAWVLRFAFFGLGDPGDGVWLFLLSMIVYGVAFDFFNVSGSLYVNQETHTSMRSSAQGLFMMMTNGLGAMLGTLAAQAIINKYVHNLPETATGEEIIEGWKFCWFLFAGYALVLAILFAILFKAPEKK